MTYTRSFALLAAATLLGCDGSRAVSPDPQLDLEINRGSPRTGPSELYVSAIYRALVVSWTDNDHNESAFQLLRSNTGPTGTFATIATTGANVTAYFDSTAAPKTGYCYQVQSVSQKR